MRRLLRHLETFGAPRLDKLITTRRPGPRTQTLTSAESTALLAKAPIHMRLFVLLCSHLALRFSEAYELTPGDHDPERHTIRVRVKGGKTRTLPVDAATEKLIDAARDTNPTARCIETLAGHSMCKEAVRATFRRTLKKAAITRDLRPHDLRRTTATLLYGLSKDLRAVQQVLGHDQLTSTLHYIAPLATENLTPLLAALYHPKKEKETVQ